LYRSETISGKLVFLHVTIATDGCCNLLWRHSFCGAEVGSENCK